MKSPTNSQIEFEKPFITIDGLVKSPEIVTPAKAGVYNHLK